MKVMGKNHAMKQMLLLYNESYQIDNKSGLLRFFLTKFPGFGTFYKSVTGE